MTDSLRMKLVSVLSGIAPIHLSEADVDAAGPYVVYDMTTSPMMDKDGVAGYVGDTKIRIVGQELGPLQRICSSIESAIFANMRDDVFGSHLLDVTKDCVEDVWTIEMNYTLKQYADWGA